MGQRSRVSTVRASKTCKTTSFLSFWPIEQSNAARRIQVGRNVIVKLFPFCKDQFVRFVGVSAIGWLSAACQAVQPDAKANGGESGTPDEPATTGECRADANFSRSPMRRITREEFANAVEDLFGPAARVTADVLPPDEVSGGYANNAVIRLQAIDLDKFQGMARQVAEKVKANLSTVLPCGKDLEGCVLKYWQDLSRKALSRPLMDEERDSFMAMYRQKAAATNHEEGVRLLVETLMQYPAFLYRPIVGEKTSQQGVLRLTPSELAARLSFFLWSSVPDKELLDAAEAGELSGIAGVTKQTHRMMDSEKFSRTLRSFALQWFAVDENTPIRNAEEFPDFNQETWNSLRGGMGKFFAQVVLDGGDLAQVLTAPYTFADKRSAKVLGLDVQSEDLVRVDTKGNERGGMMTQPAVMAKLGNTEVSRPIKRGLFVRNRLFCQDPPPPPPEGVPPFEADTTNMTVRQMLEAHRSNPSCAGCHEFFDPLGLAFSNFDGVGKYHVTEKGQQIDASGKLTETDVDGSFSSAMEFMTMIKDSQLVKDCVSRQVVRFAIGRLDDDGDKCSLESTLAQFDKAASSMEELFIAVATSNSFRFTGDVE